MPPTYQQMATAVALRFAGAPVRSVERFAQGLHHFVFDVLCADGRSFVVRLGAPDSAPFFAAARGWHGLLVPAGVPLAPILESGTHEGHPYFVLARLPGRDLGEVYGQLTREDKRRLAGRIAEVQAQVQRLPPGNGFGDAASYAGPYQTDSWGGWVAASLARSRARLAATKPRDEEALALVTGAAAGLATYFAAIAPRPFLDDTTTKNVIVAGGQLSGIVDVDWLCFGDSLTPLGLTRAALLGLGQDLDYADDWLEALSPTPAMRRAARFYTALFCLDLISETGHTFNRDTPVPADEARLERLHGALRASLA